MLPIIRFLVPKRWGGRFFPNTRFPLMKSLIKGMDEMLKVGCLISWAPCPFQVSVFPSVQWRSLTRSTSFLLHQSLVIVPVCGFPCLGTVPLDWNRPCCSQRLPTGALWFGWLFTSSRKMTVAMLWSPKSFIETLAVRSGTHPWGDWREPTSLSLIARVHFTVGPESSSSRGYSFPEGTLTKGWSVSASHEAKGGSGWQGQCVPE